MTLRFIFLTVLGVCSVLQAGLNRRVACRFDWSQATLMSSGVLFLLSVLVFFLTAKDRSTSFVNSSMETWYLLPGILGIVLVMGIPWAISKWGASLVFVSLVMSQTVASLFWDLGVESRRPAPSEIFGASLGILGVFIINFRK